MTFNKDEPSPGFDNLLVVCVGMLLLALLVYQGMGSYQLLFQPTDKTISSVQIVRSSTPDPVYQELMATPYLFGQSFQNTPAPKSVVVPKTPLNLKLEAIFFDQGQSAVMISQPGRKPVMLVEGESVRAGVVVSRIEPDKVFIDRGGYEEKVGFKPYSQSASQMKPLPTGPRTYVNNSPAKQGSPTSSLASLRSALEERAQEFEP